jgi:hypothetical protein
LNSYSTVVESSPTKSQVENNGGGHAAELLQQLRATPEPAPAAEEWDVRKRRREAWAAEVAMIELTMNAARRRLRELGIK